MKSVVVTGANGFIGRYCVRALIDAGYETCAACYGDFGERVEGARYLDFDISDASGCERLMSECKPSHLLHLAWYVEHGKYMQSPLNDAWVGYSMRLVEAFAAHGGKRLVTAGSCAEYDWAASKDGVFTEGVSKLTRSSPYAAAKNELNERASEYMSERGLSHAHGRVFFLYGGGENPNRLIPHAISSIKKREPVVLNNGNSARDYLYIKDVASAFERILSSDVEGSVNIGSGEACKLAELMRILERVMGAKGLVQAPDGGEDDSIVANNERLLGTSWRRKYTHEAAFEELVNAD